MASLQFVPIFQQPAGEILLPAALSSKEVLFVAEDAGFAQAILSMQCDNPPPSLGNL